IQRVEAVEAADIGVLQILGNDDALGIVYVKKVLARAKHEGDKLGRVHREALRIEVADVQQTDAAGVPLPVREDHQFRLAGGRNSGRFLHLVRGDVGDGFMEVLGIARVVRSWLIVQVRIDYINMALVGKRGSIELPIGRGDIEPLTKCIQGKFTQSQRGIVNGNRLHYL